MTTIYPNSTVVTAIGGGGGGNYIASTNIATLANSNGNWVSLSDPTHINIRDENGLDKELSIAEVSRNYMDALEYKRILRFARIFPEIKEQWLELLVHIKLLDPLNEKELNKLEQDALREQADEK